MWKFLGISVLVVVVLIAAGILYLATTPVGRMTADAKKALEKSELLESQVYQRAHPKCSQTEPAAVCFQKVARSNPPRSMTELALLMVLGTDTVVNEAKSQKISDLQAKLLLVDNGMLCLELVSLPHFYVASYPANSDGDRRTLEKLKELELQMVNDTRNKMLSNFSTALREIYQKLSERRPAQAGLQAEIAHYTDLVRRHQQLSQKVFSF